MEAEVVAGVSIWTKSKFIINLLICIIICVMTVYVSYIPFIRYHYLFTWHVVLGAVTYLLLFPPSFLIFDNSWFVRLTRKRKAWIHGILAGLASIFGIACVLLDFYRKEIYMPEYPSIKHFETAHAITGLLSLLLLVSSNITGAFTATVSWFHKKIYVRAITMKLMHNILGQLAFVMGVISLCLSYHILWFSYLSNFPVRVTLTIFTILVTVWSLLNSIISAKGQIITLISDSK